MKKLILLASAAVVMPSAAYAQSTGSIEFDNEVVVIGTKDTDVAGVSVPDSAKAKSVLTQDFIEHQNPGQTILDTINMVPGVNFQNNDAYGSSGGGITIRGFDSSRISLTFDGIPLNDSGNYAIYSNQMLDPELIEQVNVAMGSTDVDSPTASATGGTVNFRTRNPSKDRGGMVNFSIGEYNFRRAFGMVDSGMLTASGLRAFVAASFAKNDNPFNNYGKVDKQQYNAKVFMPLSGNDFVSVSGHYNQNRNNFFGSFALLEGDFPATENDREYTINVPCAVAGAAFGNADRANSCGTEFDRRYNPSNTGNLKINSRFALSDKLTLTLDPSYQYVKANGGGTRTGYEYGRNIGGETFYGYISGSPYAGVDLNGDGDTLDQVTLTTPSQTRTHRYGIISNLIYDLGVDQEVRVSYTLDHANHRQTGQVANLTVTGEPVTVFPVDMPIIDANGNALQKRDRQSYAILNQVAGEYRGTFGDITVNVGARLPFFKRDLNQYCFTTSQSGFVDCFGQDDAVNAAYAAQRPWAAEPQQRVLKYNKLLPNVGAVYDIGSAQSLFASYAKGLSVPGTDPLYDSFFFDADDPGANPAAETTDTFDGGWRYRSRNIQAQLGAFYTMFNNRLASAFDPDADNGTGAYVYRNLGRVNKYGLDGSFAIQPTPALAFYAFGSVLKSKIKDDVQDGVDGLGNPVFLQTGGKFESGAPTYSYGAMARANFGMLNMGLQMKTTGDRYYNDENLPVSYRGSSYPAKIPAYTLFHLDARLELDKLMPEAVKPYLQFNVYNLFDEFYVGRTGGQLSSADRQFAQIGAPRTASMTFGLGF